MDRISRQHGRCSVGSVSIGAGPCLLAACLVIVFSNVFSTLSLADDTSKSTSSSSRAQDSPRPSPSEPMVWTTIETESGPITVLRPESEVPPDQIVIPNESDGTPYNPDGASDVLFTPDAETVAHAGDETPNRTETLASTEPIESPSRRGGVTGFLTGDPPQLPQMISFGAYGGYPSAIGLQFVMPTDAVLAFRTGMTGFPGVGYLLTPGFELRFGYTPGTYSTDSGYAFSNLYIGETNDEGPNTDHWGVESGFGYRWILPDRRAVRWIAAVEFGGRWTTESNWPDQPTIRAFWMIASP